MGEPSGEPLTPAQRRVLQVYRWYRQNPQAMRYYWAGMLWRGSRWAYGAVLLVALVVGVSRAADLGGVAYVAVGALVGFVGRDLLAHRQTVQLWPAMARVVDWGAVDALLGEGPAAGGEAGDGAQ